MNKIYKVIYCKATQTWVAVSEITKGHGKGGIRGYQRRTDLPFSGRLKALTLAVLMGLGFSQQAAAEVCLLDTGGLGGGTGGAVSTGTLSLACGSGATTGKKDGSTAIGQNASATKPNSTAVGANAKATKLNAIAIGGHTDPAKAAQSTQALSIAIGIQAKTEGKWSVAIGENAEALDRQAVALGSRAEARGAQSMAIGNDTFAVGLGSISLGGDDTHTGGAATTFKDAKDNDVYYGGDNGGLGRYDATGTDTNYRQTLSGGMGSTTIAVHSQTLSEGSVAIGIGATAGKFNEAAYKTAKGITGEINAFNLTEADFNTYGTGKRATAIGASALANGEQATAIGVFARATGDESSAIGSNAEAKGVNSSAMGYDSTAYTEGSIAIGEVAVAGHETDTTKKDAIAIGTGAKATGNQSISIGYGNVVSGNNSGAIGDPSIINGANSYSVGNNNAIGSTSSDIFILGNETRIGGTLDATTGVVTDTTAHTKVIALGNEITTVADRSVFLGDKSAYVADDDARTQGTDNTYTSDNTVIDNTTLNFAGGDQVVGVVSVGSASETRRIQNVSPGEISATSTDAINGSQLYSVAEELDRENYFHTNPIDATATGNATNLDDVDGIGGAKGGQSTAAGVEAQAIGRRSVAVGYQTKASGANAVAIGSTNTAGTKTTAAVQAVAIGYGTQATASSAVAIGSGTKGNNTHTIAIGTGANANATQSTAIGYYASTTAGADRAVAVGTSAKSTHEGATALGNGADALNTQATALGHSTKASGLYSTAVGGIATASVEGATSIGHETNALAVNSSALGRGARVVAAGVGGVALGYQSQAKRAVTTAGAATSATPTAGTTVYALGSATTADKKAISDTVIGSNGAVSVGNEAYTYNDSGGNTVNVPANTRQITNLAAGAADTDAVNVAQLKAVANATTAPLTVAGNENDDTDAETLAGTTYVAGDGTQQQLGETLNIIGAGGTTVGTGNSTGVTNLARNTDAPTAGDYSAKNVQTVVSNGEVQIQLAENPEFNSVKIGDATNNTTLTSTANGLDVGGDKITNVKAGDISLTSTDAVNGSQIQNIIDNGFSIGADNGADDTVALGGTVKYTSGSGNIVTTVSNNQIDFDLANSVKIGTANPVTINGTAGTITGLTNITFDPNATYTGGQAATQEQLSAVSKVAAAADRDTYFHTNSTATAVAYNLAEDNKGKVDETAGAFGAYSLAAGYKTHAVGQNSVAVGYQNKIRQTAPNWSDDTTALGQRNEADNTKNGVLLGANNTIKASNSVATIGGSNAAVGSHASSLTGIGNRLNNGSAVNIVGIANTVSQTSGLTGPQLAAFATLQTNLQTIPGYTLTPADIALIDNLSSNMVAGTANKLIDSKRNSVLGNLNTLTKGTENFVAGFNNKLGTGLNNVQVIGSDVTVSDNNQYSVAIGSKTKVEADNSVALGSNSEANRAALTSPTTSGSQITGIGTGGVGKTVFAISSADSSAKTAITNTVKGTLGAVSVGNTDNTRQIINVAAGSEDTDAVNVAQLRAVASVATTATTASSVPLTITGNTNADTDAETIAGKTYAAGDGTQQQLGETLNIIGSTTAVTGVAADATGNATAGVYSAKNVQTVVTNGQVQIQLAENPEFTSVKTGNTTINNNGLTIVGGPSVTSTGINAGGSKITNVAAGTISANSTDAVNGSQLHQIVGYTAGSGGFALKAQDGNAVTQALGQSIEVVGGGTTTGTYSSANVKTIVNNGKVEIQLAESPKFGNVTINDGGTGKITGVTAGDINATSKDAVNGSQIHNIASKNATNVFGGNVAVNTDGSTSFTDVGGTGKNTIHDAIQSINNTANAGFTVAGASATTAADAQIAPADTLNIVGAAANTNFAQSDAGKNIYTIADANNTVRIGLANNLDVKSVKAQTVNATTSVTIGDASDPTKSTTLTSGANGLDVGGDKITNVAPGAVGANSTDAINGSQLYNSMANVNRNINSLYQALGDIKDTANAGTASALAAANLPQPHDPGASMVSAALGHYRGESALSVGVSTISDNGKWIIKGSLTHDTQSNTGVGVGVGYQW